MSGEQSSRETLRLALPKGRMQDGVFSLLNDAGIRIRVGSRSYRPAISLPDCEAKILKPQTIIEMLHVGSRDLGFAGADWVRELDADIVELLDTKLDLVRLVAAAPSDILVNGKLPGRPLVVASEYTKITKDWIASKGLDAVFVRSYGATEVFPPEDADCIVDNTATGSTLRVNRLEIVDELMSSSTRLYANPKALKDPRRKVMIDRFVLLVKSVLDARLRVMIEVNIAADRLKRLVSLLPAMRKPTISPLYGERDYAIKAAVPKKDLPTLIPKILECGGRDIVVTAPDQLISSTFQERS